MKLSPEKEKGIPEEKLSEEVEEKKEGSAPLINPKRDEVWTPEEYKEEQERRKKDPNWWREQE